MAANLHDQGKDADAQVVLAKAVASYESARFRVATQGLDRATFGSKRSPYPVLAVNQVKLGDAAAAWHAAESDLARGLSDQVASRQGIALPADKQKELALLTDRLNQIQPRILYLVGKQKATDKEATMELAMRLNVLAALLSFGFIAAIVFGMV